MAILVITVNMQCCRCKEKIDKILNCLRCKHCIEKIEYEGEKVIVRGSFCAEELRKCIWRKAGCKVIVNIIIVEVWPPPKPKPVEVNVSVKTEVTAEAKAAAEAAAKAAVEVIIKEKGKHCKPECKMVPFPYPVPYPVPCKCDGKTPCCSPPRCPPPPRCGASSPVRSSSRSHQPQPQQQRATQGLGWVGLDWIGERMAAPSSLASSHLSGLADLRRPGVAAAAPQQLRLGCSRRRAQRVVAMAGSGKFFVGGNWKCNGTKDSVSKLVTELNAATLEPDVDVVVAPPFIYIDQVKNSLTDRIEVSAQNVWIGKGGAYTGEISAEQLVDIGCQWVILGHSERRHIIGEDDQFIGKKAAYALSQNVKVIACIGELLEEREAGKTFDVCFKQMKAFADSITNWADVVIAYEPVWAIGTGKVATPEQAQEVHAAVRDWMKTNVSPEVASSIRIIYGGSVNAANCAELAKKEDIDGFLVGGASLKGPDFATIINSVTSKKVAA